MFTSHLFEAVEYLLYLLKCIHVSLFSQNEGIANIRFELSNQQGHLLLVAGIFPTAWRWTIPASAPWKPAL